MLEIYPHLFLFLPQKNGGKFENMDKKIRFL